MGRGGKGLGEAGDERRVGTECEEEGWRAGKASLMGLKKLEERGFLRALLGGEGED